MNKRQHYKIFLQRNSLFASASKAAFTLDKNGQIFPLRFHASQTSTNETPKVLLQKQLYPWAVVVKEVGMAALFEIGIFIFILFVGFLYAHKKGALQWK